MNWILRGALIISLIALVSCISAGKMWPEQTGIVLDEESRKPIEGAIVVVRWVGTISALVDSQTVCYHVESATTDRRGRYQIPAWTKMPGSVGHNEVRFTAYKPSYRHVRTDRATGELYLQRDVGGVKERLHYLSRMTVKCTESGNDRKKLINLYKALYDESVAIAVNQEDDEVVETLLFALESLQIGSIEALDRMIERRKDRR